MKYVFAIIGGIALIYLLSAYVSLEWNPLNFCQEGRVWFSVWVVVAVTVAVCFVWANDSVTQNDD